MATMHTLVGAGTMDTSKIHDIVWGLFNATKDQKIKFTLWKIPVSISVSTIRPLIVQWVGPEL